MESNKTLTEINAERKAIINEGIKNIRSKREYGVAYSASQLSTMSGGLIPAANLQASLNRGKSEMFKHGWGKTEYHLYGELWVTLVTEYKTLTYKVFDDETGELIRTFTKKKPIVKAKF